MINLSVLRWPSVYLADVFRKIQLHVGSSFDFAQTANRNYKMCKNIGVETAFFRSLLAEMLKFLKLPTKYAKFVGCFLVNMKFSNILQ